MALIVAAVAAVVAASATVVGVVDAWRTWQAARPYGGTVMVAAWHALRGHATRTVALALLGSAAGLAALTAPPADTAGWLAARWLFAGGLVVAAVDAVWEVVGSQRVVDAARRRR